eukprot:gene9798-biopygen13800
MPIRTSCPFARDPKKRARTGHGSNAGAISPLGDTAVAVGGARAGRVEETGRTRWADAGGTATPQLDAPVLHQGGEQVRFIGDMRTNRASRATRRRTRTKGMSLIHWHTCVVGHGDAAGRMRGWKYRPSALQGENIVLSA